MLFRPTSHPRIILLSGAVALAAFGCSCSSSETTTGAPPGTDAPGTTAVPPGGTTPGTTKPIGDIKKRCAALDSYLVTIYKADDAITKNTTRDVALGADLETRGKALWLEDPNAGKSVTAINTDLKARLALPPDTHAKGTLPKPTFPPDVENARKELDLMRHTTCKNVGP